MQSSSEDNQSMPSDKIASNLVKALTNPGKNNQYSVLQLLKMIKNKKNPNYQSFSAHLQKQLTSRKLDIYNIVEILRDLGDKIVKVGNSECQVKSIATGFRKYLNKSMSCFKIKSQLIQRLIDSYFCYDKSFCSVICQILQRSQKQSQESRTTIQKQLHRVIIEVLKNRKICTSQAQKCCILIHHMSLYRYFKTQDLVHIIRQANNSTSNAQQNSFFFKSRDGQILKELIEAYIIKEGPNNEGRVKKIIQLYKLNPFSYPSFTKLLNKKSLRYLMRNQEIYQIDDKIKKRPDVAECLVEILIDEGKQKFALHFINKHYLSKFYHLNKNEDRSFNKNILEKFDAFEPTQNILNKHLPKPYNNLIYLTLGQLGYKEKQVHFVNKDNLQPKMLTQISESPSFGLDSQSPFSFNQYQKKSTSIIQIAIKYQQYDIETSQNTQVKAIFLFDIQSLSHQPIFCQWVKQLAQGYKGKIVGHTVRKDFTGFVDEVCGNVKLGKLHFVDIAEIFKQKRNETKCSLDYICQKVLNKNLSKFQQCSGWGNRPLRQAQMHYAALDAALPLALSSKI